MNEAKRDRYIRLLKSKSNLLPWIEITAKAAKEIVELLEESSRPKGRWKTIAFLTAECSECHAQIHELEYGNFCPNCGADMRQ